MKYKVHVYAVARVPLEVEAESQLNAIKKANDYDWNSVNFGSGEFSEEITGFLVDEEGDEDFGQSTLYDWNELRDQGVV